MFTLSVLVGFWSSFLLDSPEPGSFFLLHCLQDSSAMDPNQTPAGPDGPDKEKMEQVSRLVHPLGRLSVSDGFIYLDGKLTIIDIDPSTTSGQAGRPSNPKAGRDHACRGWKPIIACSSEVGLSSPRGRHHRDQEDQDHHHTGGQADVEPLCAARRAVEQTGRPRRLYRYFSCCSQEVRLSS